MRRIKSETKGIQANKDFEVIRNSKLAPQRIMVSYGSFSLTVVCWKEIHVRTKENNIVAGAAVLLS